MHTLAELIPHFARLDGFAGDLSDYEKHMRNLTQRNLLPPAKQNGRVFLYDLPKASAIRIAHFTQQFGLGRTSIDPLCRWMTSRHYAPGSEPAPGMQPTMMDEAVRRWEAKETFDFMLVMASDFSLDVVTNWTEAPKTKEQERSETRAAKALKSIGQERKPVLLSLKIPASHIIGQIAPAFEG